MSRLSRSLHTPGVPLPAVREYSRPLDGRKDCARGNAFSLCPGQRELIVYAQNMNCEAAEPVHVVLGLERDKQFVFDPNVLVWPRVQASIEWGMGGQTFKAKCDVSQGTQFAVVSEIIEVYAEYKVSTPPWAPEALNPPPIYTVSGGLGYCGTRRPSFTELAMLEKPGDTVLIPVPDFAQTFTVLPVNDGNCEIRIVGDAGGFGVRGTLGVPLTNVSQYNAEDAFTLFNGARFVRVKNNNVAGPLFAFLVFELSL